MSASFVMIKVSIFSVTESWLQPTISDSTINIDGYTVFRSDFESPSPKHGVCTCVDDNIKACVYTDGGSFPNTLPLHLLAFILFVLNVYRPPSYTYEENIALIDLFTVLAPTRNLS